MNRAQLFATAARSRRGRRVGQRSLEAELRAYFETPEGQQAIAAAPGVASATGMRPMTVDDAVRTCMEEIDATGK